MDEKERNRGLGARLLGYLIDEANRDGALSIVLQCDLTHTVAQRFFLRQAMIISSLGFSVDHLEPLPCMAQAQVIDITDFSKEKNEYSLKRAQVVHQQLQPFLPTDPQKYISQISSICRNNPTRILLAVSHDNPKNVLGLATYRVIHNIQYTKRFYCDDLVTDESKRSLGVGRCLVNAMEDVARIAGADCVTLDSGCERQRAHKFYYREGFFIDQFEFTLKR